MKNSFPLMLPAMLLLLSAASCGHPKKQADRTAAVEEHYVRMKDASAPGAGASAAQIRELEAWTVDSLELDLLAASEIWDEYLGEWIALYRKSTGTEFNTRVTEAAKQLLLRATVQSPGLVKPLVRTLCGQLVASKDFAPAAAIAAYPYGFDLPGNTYSEIADRLLGATLMPGKPAPAIEGAAPLSSSSPEATIVFFYETGCRTCAPIIEEMTSVYEILVSQHVRVITVSSDKDPAKFEAYAKQMPWPDKLCDLRGFAGENFKRYCVASTPTLWVIDGKGILMDSYQTLDETGLLN